MRLAQRQGLGPMDRTMHHRERACGWWNTVHTKYRGYGKTSVGRVWNSVGKRESYGGNGANETATWFYWNLVGGAAYDAQAHRRAVAAQCSGASMPVPQTGSLPRPDTPGGSSRKASGRSPSPVAWAACSLHAEVTGTAHQQHTMTLSTNAAPPQNKFRPSPLQTASPGRGRPEGESGGMRQSGERKCATRG